MLIYPQEVKIKWTGATKKYYLDKGYKFTKMFDEFLVDISDLPVKSDKPVLVICDDCGIEFEMKYSSILKRTSINTDKCTTCSPRLNSDLSKVSERIRSEFNESGLIVENSFQYKNQKENIPFICSTHKELGLQYVSYDKFKNKGTNCAACGEERRLESRRLPFEELIEYATSRGFIVISKRGEYRNNKSPLILYCIKHGKFESSFVDFQASMHGCSSCAIDNVSGDNHFNWCGGISGINAFVRDRISPWIKDSYKHHGYACFISGDTMDLELHHTYNFHKIVKETFLTLNYEVKSKISGYTDVELTRIKETALELHYKYGLGVPLRSDIHKAFHKKYGNVDNSYEQLIEFKGGECII